MTERRYAGRAAVITGAASGIGRATTLRTIDALGELSKVWQGAGHIAGSAATIVLTLVEPESERYRLAQVVLIDGQVALGLGGWEEHDDGRLSPGQMAAMGAGQQLGQQALGHMATVQVAPTIQIRPGYHFRVLVTRDLVFSGPYGGDEEAQQ